ncbi:MAG: C39 family peptidase [Synergistaceae bacterium]|nr:C39 family peptidase [Synergistaceae bacterium]
MAVKWFHENFNGTIQRARNTQPVNGNNRINSKWWYYEDINYYLEKNKVDFEYTDTFTINDAKKRLDENKIMIVCIRMGAVTFKNDDSRIGRFYRNRSGHFIIIKGYCTIDGREYFEVYDPNTKNNNLYPDGSPKGKGRLYSVKEVSRSVTRWGNGRFITVNPPKNKVKL